MAIAINQTVPSHQRAKMNAISLTGNSIVKAGGPLLAGSMVTWCFAGGPSTKSVFVGGGWIIFGLVPLMGLVVAVRVATVERAVLRQQQQTTFRGGASSSSSSSLSSSSPLIKLYRTYLFALEQRPYVTKALTAFVVNFWGDALAQYVQAWLSAQQLALQELNWKRLQVFFWCGLLYIGPYVHAWYEHLWKFGQWMERRYNCPKQVQTIARIFYVYKVIDALVNHRVPVPSAATGKITENLRSVVVTNYCLWPVVNWISFTFVPVPLRVLVKTMLWES